MEVGSSCREQRQRGVGERQWSSGRWEQRGAAVEGGTHGLDMLYAVGDSLRQCCRKVLEIGHYAARGNRTVGKDVKEVLHGRSGRHPVSRIISSLAQTPLGPGFIFQPHTGFYLFGFGIGGVVISVPKTLKHSILPLPSPASHAIDYARYLLLHIPQRCTLLARVSTEASEVQHIGPRRYFSSFLSLARLHRRHKKVGLLCGYLCSFTMPNSIQYGKGKL